MSIAGIESITGPSLPGAATWAEVIYIAAAPAPYVPPLPGRPPPVLGQPIPTSPPPQSQWTGLLIHRELLDPTIGWTILTATYHFGYDPSSAIAYAMDWTTCALQQLNWSANLDFNMTMVIVEGTITGGTDRITAILKSLPKILPHRMVWPIWPSNNPAPLPLPPFNPLPSLHPTPQAES